MPRQLFKIRSDDDAISLLNAFLSNNLPEGYTVSLDGWPQFTLRYSGEGFDGTMTAQTAEAIIALQKAVNRIYCICRYGNINTRKLSDKERRTLLVRVEVKEGSTILSPYIQEWGSKFLEIAGNKMNGDQITLVCIFAILAIFGYQAIKRYHDRKEKTDIEHEQTERMRIFERLAEKIPSVSNIPNVGNAMHERIIRTAQSADSLEMNGVVFDKNKIKEITSKKDKSKDTRIDGDFYINSINSEDSDYLKFGLKHSQTGNEFTATISSAIDNDFLEKLALATVNHKPIALHVNAKILRDEIIDAGICVDGDLIRPIQTSSEKTPGWGSWG
ncbi:MAG: hypothetical protein KIG68_09630 [Oxalobacter sp.]|nr:hypothetical protein [Oxalobacter sp.]